MTKPFVFYFTFFDEDTEQESTFGFIIQDISPFLKKSNISHFSVDTSFYNEIFCKLENKYGVHDWSSSPNDKVDAIGYTTYEVPSEQFLNLLSEWQLEFSKIGCICSSIVEIDESASSGDDWDVYSYILSKTSS